MPPSGGVNFVNFEKGRPGDGRPLFAGVYALYKLEAEDDHERFGERAGRLVNRKPVQEKGE